MKIIYILSLILLFQGTSFGQRLEKRDVKIENLQNELKEVSSDSIKRKLTLQLANILAGKAYEGTNKGDFATAFDCYSQVFELLETPAKILLFENTTEEEHYWHELANATFNYGHLMGQTGNEKERKLYYQKAYKIAVKHSSNLYAAFSLSGLAYIHWKNMELDSAESKIQQSLSIQTTEKYSAVHYINGSIKLALGQGDKAKEIFSEAFEAAKEADDSESITIFELGLSRTFRLLNNPDSSYYYGVKSLELLNRIKEIQILEIDKSTAYENLYEHFLKFKQPDSTLKYLQLTLQEKEQFNAKKVSNLVAFQQELLKKERRYGELEKEQVASEGRNRIYLLIIALVILLLIAAFILYGYRQKQKANLLLSAQKNTLEDALSQLKSTQSQLIQSEKMASLGELTAGIAHEIQNPLNFVNNFSEVTEELVEELEIEGKKEQGERDRDLEKELFADIKDNLIKINHHGNRASSIVKGMLEHSRTSSGKKELTDINALADEYLRLAYHGLRAKEKDFNAEMVADFDKNIPKIEVIPQDIGRVFLNLINNAFQAVSEEGERRKAHGDLKYKPLVTVLTKLKANSQLLIAIKDNGPGIPDEIKDKIFQPFFTTKDSGKGTGLGLSLAYDIVKAHGGEISVDSEVGKGTQFLIRLPV